MIVISLKDVIDTSYSGHKKLLEFYNKCRDHTNQTIHMDFYGLDWIDANMCALLEAILYKLKKENALSFSTDFEFLRSKFDVLFRNGFLKDEEKVNDVRQSTISAQNFASNDKKGFVQYVTNDLMEHRGIPNLGPELKDKMIDDLIEVFCNTHHHANTHDPVFVAGQYYPKAKLVKFTMVDLGDGFLPKINKATRGSVDNDNDAIIWALQGNSSKLMTEKTPGGLGLKGIHDYCIAHKGQLDIVTGSAYWSTSHKGTIFEFGRKFNIPYLAGTTISLVFNKN